MQLQEQQNDSDLNPWNLSSEPADVSAEQCAFDDDFTREKNIAEFNENGLCLPDSQKYLNYLENRLKRLQSGNLQRGGTQARKMLKELAAKRDGLLLESSNKTCDTPEIHDEDSDTIKSAITNLALYESVERKLFPHLHSNDPEESKKLVNHDILEHVIPPETTSVEQQPSQSPSEST